MFYADCLTNNDNDDYKIVSGGEFKEYCDGTASLEMVVESINNTNQRFSINVVYSGRTFTAPAGRHTLMDVLQVHLPIGTTTLL
ncbi:MAG: hypothetical protein IPL08_06615 [Saprospiraceae bacterium]|nr:hypothetical protein [Saprospiraceae bacterium]